MISDTEKRAREVVNRWTAVAAGVSWIPGSTLLLAGADAKMINDIANIFEVRGVTAEQVLAAVGASVTGKTAAEALSFIPGPGWIAKGAVATGITKALGEAVIKYMKARSPITG